MKRIVVLGVVLGLGKCAFAGTPTITVYGEEIVVTATKVEKRIGDVPVSAYKGGDREEKRDIRR